MAKNEARQIHPVIVTDRIVAPGHTRREWELSKPLICWEILAGYEDILVPVLVVVDNKAHLAPLASYGLALAHMHPVIEDDFAATRTDHRAIRAFNAQAKVGAAMRELTMALQQQILPEGVATAALARLRKGVGYVEPFTQSWISASLMYAPMAINSLRQYEQAMQKVLFGGDNRSTSLKDKDRQRARDYYRALRDRLEVKTDDEPSGMLVKPLTEKMLAAILPKLLPEAYIPKNIDITDLEIVTRPGRRVSTKKPDSQDGKPAQRSAWSVPGVTSP
jgi:hypothetical protein